MSRTLELIDKIKDKNDQTVSYYILTQMTLSYGESLHSQMKYISFKKIIKCILVLQVCALNEVSNICQEMTKNFTTGQYDKINTLYDNLFSKDDQIKANKFFLDNPDKSYYGSRDGAMYSYIRGPNNSAIRRDKELGRGSFGRVKKDSQDRYAIKRQKVTEKNIHEIQQEAKRNYDLRLTDDENTNIIQTRDGKIIKHYQKLKLGTPLIDKLSDPLTTDEQRLDYAIQLLNVVEDLHTGRTSRTGKKYAHLDINPKNIIVDSDGKLLLIDYGFSIDSGLNNPHFSSCGTKKYRPFNIINKKTLDVKVNIKTESYFFDDIIATLRTIYHPFCGNSNNILSKNMWENLPQHIKNLLNTNNIQECMNNKIKLVNIKDQLQDYKNSLTISVVAQSSPSLNVITTQPRSLTRDNKKEEFLKQIKNLKKKPLNDIQKMSSLIEQITPDQTKIILGLVANSHNKTNLVNQTHGSIVQDAGHHDKDSQDPYFDFCLFPIFVSNNEIHVNSAVNNLLNKSRQLMSLSKNDNDDYCVAAQDLLKLTFTIRNLILLKKNEKHNKMNFTNEINNAVDKYTTILKQPRNKNNFLFKTILISVSNIVCSILTIGTANALLRRWSIFNPKTDSAKIIEKSTETLSKNINKI